jgi:hypothetical protein
MAVPIASDIANHRQGGDSRPVYGRQTERIRSTVLAAAMRSRHAS